MKPSGEDASAKGVGLVSKDYSGKRKMEKRKKSESSTEDDDDDRDPDFTMNNYQQKKQNKQKHIPKTKNQTRQCAKKIKKPEKEEPKQENEIEYYISKGKLNDEQAWEKLVKSSIHHFDALKKNSEGSLEFMNAFVKLEEKLFENNNTNSVIRIDGLDKELDTLDKHFSEEDKVVVTSNIEKLEFKGKDFNLKMAREVFKKAEVLDVINTRTGRTMKADLRLVLNVMENPNADNTDAVYNVLSLEVSNHPTLSKKIRAPTFVHRHSLVLEMRDKLESQIERLQENAATLSQADRKRLQALKLKFAQFETHIPHYEKYIIFSQRGAYTGLHVDLAGSAVYYYVCQGQKVIYFAPPTPENMQLYKELELSKGSLWQQDPDVLRRFERVVVNAGEMVLIPPGYLHFVYTPVNSLVIGGNFLTLNFIRFHFMMTHFEEINRKNSNLARNQMFKNFHDFMFYWLEDAYLPPAETTPLYIRCGIHREVGLTLLRGLQNRTVTGPMFPNIEKKALIKRLMKVLGQETKSSSTAEDAEENADTIDFTNIKIQMPKAIVYPKELN